MIKSLLTRFAHPLAVTAIAATAASSAQAGTLSIGHTTWVGYGTLYLARDLGYFKEQGLEVELTTIEESSMYMAAQASGKLSGSASTIDEILKYRSKDFCFKAVAALPSLGGARSGHGWRRLACTFASAGGCGDEAQQVKVVCVAHGESRLARCKSYLGLDARLPSGVLACRLQLG